MVLKMDYRLSTVLFELSGAGLKQMERKQTMAPVKQKASKKKQKKLLAPCSVMGYQ